MCGGPWLPGDSRYSVTNLGQRIMCTVYWRVFSTCVCNIRRWLGGKSMVNCSFKLSSFSMWTRGGLVILQVSNDLLYTHVWCIWFVWGVFGTCVGCIWHLWDVCTCIWQVCGVYDMCVSYIASVWCIWHVYRVYGTSVVYTVECIYGVESSFAVYTVGNILLYVAFMHCTSI